MFSDCGDGAMCLVTVGMELLVAAGMELCV